MTSSLATLRALISGLCADIAERDFDWAAVIALANRTLTTPSLAAALAENPHVPEDVAQFLETVLVRTRVRNKLMLEQLTETVAAMNGIGIEPILLKGSAMLAHREARSADRLFLDLDLMVPEASAEDVAEVMAQLGYQREQVYATIADGANFYREHDVGGVDLHCRLRAPYPSYDYEEIRAGSRCVTLGSSQAILPSPEWQAAILILHDQLQEGDYWRGTIDVRHLLDIQTIATDCQGLNWEELYARFPSGHARRALNTQLLTLADLFEVKVPPQTTRDVAARLQLRRRKLQLHVRWIAPILAGLSYLLDPPLGAGELSASNTQGRPKVQFFRVAKRLFRQHTAAKL